MRAARALTGTLSTRAGTGVYSTERKANRQARKLRVNADPHDEARLGAPCSRPHSLASIRGVLAGTPAGAHAGTTSSPRGRAVDVRCGRRAPAPVGTAARS
jgi:hypothetical protein